MFEHRAPHQTALPPPSSEGAAYDRHPPRSDRAPLATTVAKPVVVAAVVIVLALAFIATMPAAVLAPTAILFIGGLIAGSLAMRTRATLTRRAVAPRRMRGARSRT